MRSPEGEAWLLAHVYLVGNASYQQPLAAKLAYGWQSIWRPAPTGVIALAARCGPANCDDARARIADIWDNQHSRLRAMMSAGASRPQ